MILKTKKKLIAIMFLLGIVSSVAVQNKPNIIFIYTDDQADWTVGISGNAQAHTPNLDRLAKGGAYFKNAYVTTPVCSPARVALITGQYASEYGVSDFIPQKGHKLYDEKKPIGLDTSSITFAEVLKKEGYKTALIGKWHVGEWSDTDKKFHPTNHGFDYFMGLKGGGVSPNNPTLEKDGKSRQFKGLTDDILTEEAISFIDNNKKQPFLLNVHYRAPHTAWLPVAEEDWAPYKDMDPIIPNPNYPDLNIPKVKSRMKEYLASVSGIDRNVGKILKRLEELHLSENTIVIFTSDHGYNMGHNGIEHKGNGIWITKSNHPASKNIAENSRPNLYNNSLRVPAFIKWPAKITPGMVIDKTISSLDWYPTILEMAGAKVPKQKILRGKSVLPLLKKEPVKKWDNDFYAEYSMINYSKAYMRSYQTPEWKLVKDFLDPSRDELYHLKKDPQESVNLIKSSSKQATGAIKKLTGKITNKMKEINDPLLEQIKNGFK